jgi:AcrR family transcriptional regulator
MTLKSIHRHGSEMAKNVKPRRTYDSPRRREQAAATRSRILEAAVRLFERDGYAATSVAAIAEEADVSVKTVYLGFEDKRGLIRAAWHLVLRGERDDVPVGEQAWFREVVDEPDPARQLRLNARNSRVVKERAGALMEVLRGAAATDPEIDELWQRIQSEFHANQGSIVALLDAKGALREGLDAASATDIMWTLNHPAVYRLLVGDRGWTPARYERWLGDSLCRQLLAAPPG